MNREAEVKQPPLKKRCSIYLPTPVNLPITPPNSSNRVMDKKRHAIKPTKELVSPGLYHVLDFYIQQYSPLLLCSYSATERKLVLKPPLFPRQIAICLSALWDVVHTLICLFLLLQQLSQKRTNSNSDAINTFVLFYYTILPPAFMMVNFTIAAKPSDMCNLLNPMEGFRNSILGLL